MSLRHKEAHADLMDAAREIRRIHGEQQQYIQHLQELAAEARKTGKSLSHKIQPRAFDYGNAIEKLIDALDRYDP